jgi:ribosome-associated heat shock protein Hsp15
MDDTRIDKWLWAARFFKTRGLAQTALETGRVLVDDERVKVARAVRLGDRLLIRIGDLSREVIVMQISGHRGPAPVAQLLYQETEASIRKRVEAVARRALNSEPANAIVGRPTKRDRRELDRLRSDD